MKDYTAFETVEVDEFLGDPAPGDMLEPGKEHALGDKPFS
uniref:Uncharacterized protein n=1 Tax=Vitis vinifera TaxID=29760 RepID=F6HBW1_VITVI